MNKASFVLHGYVPDRKLLPNNRRSARADEKLRRQQRADVAALLGPQPLSPIMFTMLSDSRVKVQITVCWPREKVLVRDGPGRGESRAKWMFKAFPDGSNLNAAMKGLEDALADKVGVNDKYFDLLPPKQLRDETGDGYTLIELEVV